MIAKPSRHLIVRTHGLCVIAFATVAAAGAIAAGCATTAAAPACEASANTATIRVVFAGITPAIARGTLHVALWKDEATFMKEHQWLQGTSVAATTAVGTIDFQPVPEGTYAISAFIDTSDCGQFRRGAFGIPVDPWAVSGGGPAWIPPNWKRAAFRADQGFTEVLIDFSHGAKK